MNRAENDLFRRAIVEALSQNNREELAECTDPVVCSKQHYRKMSAILGFRVRKPIMWTRTRKMWVAAIIAAALLLTGCAVANYKAIGEFIINIYEDIIKMQMSSVLAKNPDAKIFTISSSAHQGLTELLRELSKLVRSNPFESVRDNGSEIASEPRNDGRERSGSRKGSSNELPTISLSPATLKDTWQVEKLDEDHFRVTGEKIEKFARRTDLNNYASVNRLRDIMKKMGI